MFGINLPQVKVDVKPPVVQLPQVKVDIKPPQVTLPHVDIKGAFDATVHATGAAISTAGQIAANTAGAAVNLIHGAVDATGHAIANLDAGIKANIDVRLPQCHWAWNVPGLQWPDVRFPLIQLPDVKIGLITQGGAQLIGKVLGTGEAALKLVGGTLALGLRGIEEILGGSWLRFGQIYKTSKLNVLFKLPKCAFAGLALVTSAKLIPDAKQVVFEFVAANGDVLLSLTFQVSVSASIKCNSKIGGKWGTEQVYGLAKGAALDLCVKFGADAFQIYLNKQHMFDFKYRGDISAITSCTFREGVQDVALSFFVEDTPKPAPAPAPTPAPTPSQKPAPAPAPAPAPEPAKVVEERRKADIRRVEIIEV